MGDRHVIFITSLGRTGTHFLGNKMAEMIDGCASFHEPDVLVFDRPGEWLPKLFSVGLYRSTLGKLSSRHSPRQLNYARRTGQVSDEEAIRRIRQFRSSSVEKAPEVYLEANGQFYALVDLLPEAFPGARVVHICRDPRTWVQSWMNKTIPPYSFWDYINWLPRGRITPRSVGELGAGQWDRMSTFEKLCWWWDVETRFVLDRSVHPGVKVVRYEDLFSGSSVGGGMAELLEFITCRGPGRAPIGWTFRPDVLRTRTNQSRPRRLGAWEGWPGRLARTLHRHCGELMRSFGYGEEEAWGKRLGAV